MTNQQGGVDKVIYKELSYRLVGLLFDVYNELGYGYKEIVYERAVEAHLIARQIQYIRQASYNIQVQNRIVGRGLMDFIIDNKIVLELKRGKYFSRHNINQVNQYLKLTNYKLGIIANFTPTGVKFLRILN